MPTYVIKYECGISMKVLYLLLIIMCFDFYGIVFWICCIAYYSNNILGSSIWTMFISCKLEGNILIISKGTQCLSSPGCFGHPCPFGWELIPGIIYGWIINLWPYPWFMRSLTRSFQCLIQQTCLSKTRIPPNITAILFESSD